MADWTRITHVAEQQHLLIAPWQIRAAGISAKALHNHIDRHAWVRGEFGMIWLPGQHSARRRLAAAVLTYSSPRGGAHRARSLMAAGLDPSTALARAALNAGQTVCGLSAAWLHGLADMPDVIWLRLPGRTGHAKRPSVNLRYGRPDSVQWIDGLPVTEVEQTIVDVAATARGSMRAAHYELCRMVALAHAKRLTTPARLEAWLSTAGAVDGSLLLNGVLSELRGELVHSGTERRARALAAEVLATCGLRLHPTPYRVDLDGRAVGEADLAVVELCLDLEIDGPHHHLPAQVVADQRRDRLLRRAGWRVERFAAEEVDLRPQAFKAALRAILAEVLTEKAKGTVLSRGT